jgi:glutamyl-tRNA reductase
MQLSVSNNPQYIASRFCIVGINSQRATAKERSLFAVTALNRERLLADAKQKGFRSLFVLSTCNRTELYGFCESDIDMTELLLQYSDGTTALFGQHGFVRRGYDAFEYLFKVASGLQSQITGDYEIAGQLRDAVAQSRKQELIGPLMDRTVSYALQASKAVRSSTSLSSGTVSVSYAAVKWLNEKLYSTKKSFLVIGSGALGRSVVKNIHQYLEPREVAVTNRTDTKALALASETNSVFKSFAALDEAVQHADIIIVCTHAPGYLLWAQQFTGAKPVTIIDLSVPQNVDPAVKEICGITLAGVDEVSQILNLTYTRRSGEIPKAEIIIQQHLLAFYEWLSVYQHTPLIKDMKKKLYDLGGAAACFESGASVRSRVNKTVGAFAMNLRDKQEKGCQYIHAINEFLKDAQ